MPLARPSTLIHVRAEHGVDPRLVPRPLRLEPLENVGIHPERNRELLDWINDRRVVPKIVREIRQFARRGRLDLSAGDTPESSEVGPAPLSLATST